MDETVKPKQATGTEVATRRAVVVLAWAAMLLASDLPLIIWREVFRFSLPSWRLVVFQLVSLLVLLGLSLLWSGTRPIARFIGMMAAFRLGWSVMLPVLQATEWWVAWFRQPNTVVRQIMVTVLPLGTPVLMGLALIGWRGRRRDLFLTWGDWRKPVVPGGRLNWFALFFLFNLFAVGWLVLGSVLGGVFNRGSGERVAVLLPAILVAAALNGLREELEYRVLPLSQGQAVLGQGQALLLTSVLFGLAHWYGTPPGAFGVFTTALGGAMMGASILGTRGSGWALFSHWLGDVVLYTGLVFHNGGFTIQ